MSKQIGTPEGMGKLIRTENRKGEIVFHVELNCGRAVVTYLKSECVEY